MHNVNGYHYLLKAEYISCTVSARALSCLTNSTQIQVETGPHFGGKVRGGAVKLD
jgi:hypothetical protein